MKKILLISTLFFFVGFIPYALAQGFVPLAPIPGLTQGVAANSEGLATFFNNLYKYLIGLAAALAVVEIIWGGLEYSTQDSVSKKSNGKERIYQAILGLVLVLSPALVFSIINPSILNLSLNIPPLETKTTTKTPDKSVTQDITLSDTDKALREASGGKVIFTFIIAPTEVTKMSAVQLGKTLDTKQDECTQKTQGTGIILSQTSMGGGGFTFVCQTCPPNTTVTLFAKGKTGAGARGVCQPK